MLNSTVSSFSNLNRPVLVERSLLEIIEQTWRVPYSHNPPMTQAGEAAIEHGLAQLRVVLARSEPTALSSTLDSQVVTLKGGRLIDGDGAPATLPDGDRLVPLLSVAFQIGVLTAEIAQLRAQRDATAAGQAEPRS